MHGVVVYVRCELKDVSCPKQMLGRLVRTVCGRFGLANATVSIAIVGDKCIRKLNRQFLNRKTVTDCLAFDLSESKNGRKWFELVVNGQRAISEAAKRGHPVRAELALYVTHGLLHNLGFNDLKPAQAVKMHRLENEILQQEGFGLVYSKTAKSHRAKC
jgi:probable rRNA maturation factor